MHAYDLDPDMVSSARRRLARYLPSRVRIAVGDATHLPEPDETFDALFDFGVLHHVPDWRAAVREVRRVLKPGGHFFFEEVTRQALERWVSRTFLDHPRENRFSAAGLHAELEGNDLHVGGQYVTPLFGSLVLGVGQRR